MVAFCRGGAGLQSGMILAVLALLGGASLRAQQKTQQKTQQESRQDSPVASPRVQDPEPVRKGERPPPQDGDKGESKERQGTEFSEYEIKAAYLMQFLRYCEWPTRKDAKGSPLVIGIVGKNPFGKVFAAVQGKEIEGTEEGGKKRKLEVRELAEKPTAKQLAECHIVFFSSSTHGDIGELLAAVKGLPVLTVAEGELMLERGITFAFVLRDKRVRIELNSKAAKAAEVRVNAQLQRVVVRRL